MNATPLANVLHSSYFHPVLRQWHRQPSSLSKSSLVYPIYVVSPNTTRSSQPLPSLPGQARHPANDVLVSFLGPLVEKGLTSVIIFGVIDDVHKSPDGAFADRPDAPVLQAIKIIKRSFPELLIAVDVCLCGYTDHGHCYIPDLKTGGIHHSRTVARLAQISLAFAECGAHVIAPSDMNDGRVGAIKAKLQERGLENRVAVMSYSAKFCSSFYGPFREAANSAPAKGGREGYQLPVWARGLALQALDRDVRESADILMIKPALPYLDIIRDARNRHPNLPIAAYQVSGEYAMLYHAAATGSLDLRQSVMECLECLARAGCSVVLTYFAKQILEECWI